MKQPSMEPSMQLALSEHLFLSLFRSLSLMTGCRKDSNESGKEKRSALGLQIKPAIGGERALFLP